ncbi:peptidoglycan bridge formation glycyltransferase FemA/FemB family protein [Floccifex sp.]|uniref:peptidoglycan bridge formation glycyltransferase FemA/FemB family protein n=1 Tax=Floccifex sp. TaxID=2815810 RepID=UPI0029FEE927|nr:peptidoglycan bridge formation glycyltransferase FemA/FemB family protein [Floccifex sp.]MDD7280664.1 peptidoglycan bridge formation glycyltransferase FemA/FemB family protein [Erysipelotrichaceae bacterium]MDY2958263.1 peptidoglycan bridge formation glycyltransferase FemA/FemB family protein [Floccifex sp.]
MNFVQLTEEEYAKFQQHHPYNNFLNSIDTYHLEQMEQLECELVGIKEGQEVLCACLLVKYPMMKLFHYYYAPRGFLIDYSNEKLFSTFTSELKKYIKQKGGVQLIVDPYILYQQRDQEGNVVEGGFSNAKIVQQFINEGYNHKGFSIGYDQNMQTIRWMYAMDLSQYTKESLWKALHQQTRWSINRTIKYQLQVRELGIDELDLFVDIMEKTGERRGFGTRGKEFYKHQMMAYNGALKCKLAYLDTNLLRDYLLKEKEQNNNELNEINEKLLEVPNSKKFNKKKKVIDEAIEINAKKLQEVDSLEKEYGSIIPMAASMFIYDQDEVVYLTSGAYEQFRDFYASYAIQWHVINEAMDLGYKKYNFYGISGNFDPKDENYGVYAFKKGFPGHVEELVGDFELVCRPSIYKLNKIRNSR